MAQPTISIAIPVFNQASTIEATINSAIRATEFFPGTEIIVSENHSNDGTAELLSQYIDRVRIVRPSAHLSMSANWNYAVNSCVHEWVGMLSGDDKLYPAYIPSIRKAILKSRAPVFAMGGWNVLDLRSGKRKSHRILSLPSLAKAGSATPSLIAGPKASFASFCFLKSAFDQVGGFSERYQLVQDWILQFELSLLGDFVKTNKIIAEYTCGQIRPDLERCRVPLYCQDLATFCLSTIWKAEHAGIQRSQLVDACQAHIVRAETLVSLYPEWEEQVDVFLRPAYELIGREMISLRMKSPPNKSALSLSFKTFFRNCLETLLPR
jgi:glycosyltransferase involved in cell wall biosynthesis